MENSQNTVGITAEQATNDLQKLLRKCKRDGMMLSSELQNVRNSDKYLPLLEDLCQKGANLQYLGRERRFSLIPNVFWSEKLIQFFIDRGMDINSRDVYGETALHLALCHLKCTETYMQDLICPNNNPVKVIKYLLDQKADPNITNLRGENAIFALANGEWALSEKKYASKLARLFRKRGMETRNIYSETVLHIHSWHLNNPFIELISESVDNTEVRNSSSWLYSQTPLMCAARCARWEYCKLLIEKGADVNARDLQGYTALHYSVVEGLSLCTTVLLDNGADPETRSASGRSVYDLDRYKSHSDVAVCKGANSPTKLAELYELGGAEEIMKNTDRSVTKCLDAWEQVIGVCKKFDLQPSAEFLDNYEFIRLYPEDFDEIYESAINTVARLSESEMSKFWNLLSFAIREYKDNTGIIHTFLDSYIFLTLDFLSEDLKRFVDFASFEIADFKTLFKLIDFFEGWLKDLVESGSKNEVTPECVSHVHSIARLSIACFNILMHVTKCDNQVSNYCMDVYITLCCTLTSLHSRFEDVLSKEAFNDNKELLRNLLKLDLRSYRDGNSLLHRILRNAEYERGGYLFESFVFGALVDLVGDVTTRNAMGFEPVQYTSWIHWLPSVEGFVKMAERGAHVDARSVRGFNPMTLREAFEKQERWDLMFRYDSLKCACARVLAKSLVPYANRVPKKIVHFIGMH